VCSSTPPIPPPNEASTFERRLKRRRVRILVVSNFYPPRHVGGYEIACKQAVDALRLRGHDVAVLTSTHGVARPVVEDGVHRLLSYRPLDWHRRPRVRRSARILLVELRNRAVFRRAARALQPDVVQFWNMAQISLSAVDQARRMGLPSSLYVHDSWLARLPIVDPWYRATTALRSEPRFRHVQFASGYLRDRALEAGRRIDEAEAVHWGVDTRAFGFRAESRPVSRLLYAGQIEEQKGVDVAVEALAQARAELGAPLTLTIVGRTSDPRYLEGLRALAAARGVERFVEFRDAVPHDALVGVYHAHDVLLFPSRSPHEGLPLTLLEAMAAGTTVVGTTAGGAVEVLRDGESGLTVPIGDVPACATRVAELAREPELAERVRRSGRRLVETQFELERTIDGIERGLEKASRMETSS
jgi:glycosyltransferase involved in cell wall biosynthesis